MFFIFNIHSIDLEQTYWKKQPKFGVENLNLSKLPKNTKESFKQLFYLFVGQWAYVLNRSSTSRKSVKVQIES